MLVNDFLRDRRDTQQLIKYNLTKVQERMKWYSNKKRTDRTFEVGAEVYLKLQPYRQQSINERGNHKLSAKYYGSYRVLDRIGQVAYKLELPSSSKIHDIFHVFQLKKVSDKKDVQTSLPGISNTGVVDPQPTAILDRKLLRKEISLLLWF